MKNILFTFSLVVVFVASLTAQEGRRGYIGIALGGAAPIGNFADDDLQNEDAGLATSGTSLSLIDFGYKLSDNFGVAASIGGGVFTLGDDILDLSLIYAGIFVGPLLSYPVTDRLEVNFIPKFARVSGSVKLDDEELAEETAFGFDLALSLRYHLGEKWSLSLNSGYAQNNFEDYKTTSINTNLGIAFRLR